MHNQIKLSIIISIIFIILFSNQVVYGARSNINNNEKLIYTQTNGQSGEIRPDEECLIDCDDIVTGQIKDGIPSINNPVFVGPEDPGAPDDDNEVIIGVYLDGNARAYPYSILNWHEIVNDKIGDQHFSVTYCPLTGSGILYHTEVIDNSELGTSGKLYENNLVFYDRISDSYWSQMLNQAIKGDKMGDRLNYSTAIETKWGTWKNLYPNTKVLSNEETGYSRQYDRYPYGNYLSDNSIYFRTTYNPDIPPYNLYHPKALTTILNIDNSVKLLPFDELEKTQVLNHDFQNQSLITIFNPDSRLSVTFSSVLTDGTQLKFSPAMTSNQNITETLGLPVFQDNLGTLWNFNGLSISGASMHRKLIQVPTYNAFWFAASTFFHNASIFANAELIQFDNYSIYVEKSSYVFSVDPKVQEEGFLDYPKIYFLVIPILLILYIRKKQKLVGR